MVNEFQLYRVSDMMPLQALSSIVIKFDCDSWVASISATLPWAQRDAVMPDPDPVEIEASVNGIQFRFLLGAPPRTSRRFGQRTVDISGNGVACELADPYASTSQHTNLVAMTAQQLIDQALGYTGYTQTWSIDDWLVPAGALSLSGTPAAVAAHVAEAAGAVLAADWSLRDLRMLPRYPVLPWNWSAATPDVVIPADLAESEGTEPVIKPDYNLVYVSGVTTGVLGQVKITGSAGDRPAPMVTHPLITAGVAARQKGSSILGESGRRIMRTISLPVLPELGVIDQCKLVEFAEGGATMRGLSRANEIRIDWPKVRQSVTLETRA